MPMLPLLVKHRHMFRMQQLWRVVTEIPVKDWQHFGLDTYAVGAEGKIN